MDDGEDKYRYEIEKENNLLSVESVMSINRFRSFISSVTGGDGKEHPAIEHILARDSGKEEEIMEAAREFYK